jgi:hypothetical protein
MRRFVSPLPSLMLLLCISVASASATNYYVAANGSDSNDGTSKTAPWLHAPGMKGCSGNCAAASPNAGDQFIFRGGDTWHYSSGSPVGLPWAWNWSGSSSNPIYVGVDQSWSAGGSWSRPILTMDNPLSTGRPSSCAFDDTNSQVAVVTASNVTFDNFEFTGKCWAGSPSTASIVQNGNHLTFSNLYFHGWTMAASASSDSHKMISGSGSGNTGNVYADNLFDGSDSTFGNVCTTPGCVGNYNSTYGAASGWAIAGECYDVHGNIFRHVSNGIECGNITLVHDNLFEYLFEPVNSSPHGNVVESLGGYAGETAYFYNNVTRNVNEGVNWWPQFSNAYIFNNVWENDGHYSPDPNCLMISPPGFSSGAGVVNAYIYNNTFDGTCKAQAQAGNATTPHWASGSALIFLNNHILDRTSISGFFTCYSPSVCGATDNGGEAFQTTSAANAQGYTLANNYQPTSGSDATVGVGKDISGSCSTFSADKALCNGTSDGAKMGPGNTATSPAIALIVRASSWDAGAYEFGSGASKPNPPSALAAQVQ